MSFQKNIFRFVSLLMIISLFSCSNSDENEKDKQKVKIVKNFLLISVLKKK